MRHISGERTPERSASELPASAGERQRALLIALRYVLPAVVVLAGLIVMALGSEIDLEGGATIVSAGLATFAMSWLYRASVDGDREREQEEAARAYFTEHGHWPGEGGRV